MEYTDGQTPLEEDEKLGLRIGLITNRGELDEYEQQNIEIAIQWIYSRDFKQRKVGHRDQMKFCTHDWQRLSYCFR